MQIPTPRWRLSLITASSKQVTILNRKEHTVWIELPNALAISWQWTLANFDILVLSTSIAIFSVLKFYTATKAVTKSKKPLPKLIAFKAIVFINFLQNVSLFNLSQVQF